LFDCFRTSKLTTRLSRGSLNPRSERVTTETPTCSSRRMLRSCQTNKQQIDKQTNKQTPTCSSRRMLRSCQRKCSAPPHTLSRSLLAHSLTRHSPSLSSAVRHHTHFLAHCWLTRSLATHRHYQVQCATTHTFSLTAGSLAHSPLTITIKCSAPPHTLSRSLLAHSLTRHSPSLSSAVRHHTHFLAHCWFTRSLATRHNSLTITIIVHHYDSVTATVPLPPPTTTNITTFL
jgi:hypothetical protein